MNVQTRAGIGTLTYLHPYFITSIKRETKVDLDTLKRADVYSFGLILWSLLNLKIPFEGVSLQNFVVMANNNEFGEYLRQNCLRNFEESPKELPTQKLYQLFLKCTCSVISDVPLIDDVISELSLIFGEEISFPRVHFGIPHYRKVWARFAKIRSSTGKVFI